MFDFFFVKNMMLHRFQSLDQSHLKVARIVHSFSYQFTEKSVFYMSYLKFFKDIFSLKESFFRYDDCRYLGHRMQNTNFLNQSEIWFFNGILFWIYFSQRYAKSPLINSKRESLLKTSQEKLHFTKIVCISVTKIETQEIHNFATFKKKKLQKS